MRTLYIVDFVSTVYPRVCGGTPESSAMAGLKAIPACAGEPYVWILASPGPVRVYPRVCGGNR